MKSSRLLFFVVFCLVMVSSLNALAITVEITATVQGCGDGSINFGEQCEGLNLGGSSCTSQGFLSGSLSCSSACTFNTSQCVASSGSGSNGGGSNGGGSNSGSNGGGSLFQIPIPDTNVVFTGRAYPLSRVTILKDGQIVVTTIAGPDSNFSATISGLSTGNYVFGIYGEDKNNIRSNLFTFPIYITSGVTTKIGGVFIAPTIGIDKSEVKQGDNLVIFGQSTPKAEVTIHVHSKAELFIKKKSDDSGVYLLNLDTAVLEMGQHITKSKVAMDGEVSAFSTALNFAVGTKNVFTELPQKTKLRGNLNNDDRVNIVDFSILAYWYKRPNLPVFMDLNQDGKVDLIDFSIMAFNWTG